MKPEGFCRLCLQKFAGVSKPIIKSTETWKMLRGLFPGMNIDLVAPCAICRECLKYVQFSYSMKETVSKNEEKIRENVEAIKIIEDKVCRLCLNKDDLEGALFLYDDISQTIPFLEARNIVEIAVIDMNFELCKKPVICNNCWEIVRSIYLFKKRCFATEKILKFYCLKYNVVSVTNEQIESISNCYNSHLRKFSKGDNQCSSNDFISKNKLDSIVDSISISTGSIVKPVDIYKNNFSSNDDDTFEEEIDDIFIETQPIDEKSTIGIDNECAKIQNNNVDSSKQGDFKSEVEKNQENSKKEIKPQDSASKLPASQNVKESAKKDKVKGKRKYRKDEDDMFFCEICGYKSKYSQHLIRHLLTHNTDECFTCPKCIYSTNIERNLERHIKTHEIEKVFKCDHCNYSTIDQNGFEEHEKTHSLEITGKKGGKQLADAEIIKLHAYRCDQCPYTTNREDIMKQHLTAHKAKEKVHKCPHCHYITLRSHSLKKHVQFHDKTTKNNENVQKSKGTSGTVKKPVLKFKCTTCSFSAARRTHLESHKITHKTEYNFECSKCDYKSKRKSHMVTHMLRHQDPDKKVTNQCAYCKYNTIRKEHLRTHYRNIHFNKPEVYNQKIVQDSPTNSYTQKKIKKCPGCTYRGLKHALDVHIFTVHLPSKSKLLHCHNCSYKSSSRKVFLNHMKGHKSLNINK